MYKQKVIIQGGFSNKWFKFTQVAVIVCGVALTHTPAFAKKAIPKPESTTEVNQMVGNGNEGNCTGQISSPSKLTLPLGKSTLIKLPEPLSSRTVGNSAILQAKMIAPLTLYVLGLDIGTTNMIIQGKSGACSVIDVTVSMDPDGLQQTLNVLMPEEKNIKVTAAAESIILSGTVEDSVSASRAIDIAQAYVAKTIKPVAATTKENQDTKDSSQQSKTTGQYSEIPNARVINMLSVSAQQQVMLEVKIAEISKSLLDKLGASLSLSQTSGSWTYRILSDFLSTTGSATGGAISAFKTASKNFAIDAEKKDGLVKILAEPTIMAISGQEGSFLAGGKIFIPVSQTNSNGTPTITLEEKEFGVGVKFTPTVLAGGRINLRVAPEVSELDKNGIGITAAGISGTAILPSFTTRRASTTVQLMDGQSFAIGGLIKNNTTTNIKAFPILGEIPILGALFRSTEFQKDKTELVFIVTPHLVKPLPTAGYRLPTDHYVDPTRSDLFLNGKMEGQLPANAPLVSPASVAQPAAIENKDGTLKPNEPATNTGFDVR